MRSLTRSPVGHVFLVLLTATLAPGAAWADPSPFASGAATASAPVTSAPATSAPAASAPPAGPPAVVAPSPGAAATSAPAVGSPAVGPRVEAAPAAVAPSRGVTVIDVHRTLGLVALGTFATALTISAASGNLAKLMDPDRCCPDGGQRREVWRTTDRVLVNAGIVSYSGAAALAIYHLLTTPGPRSRHRAHRWLALGHGAAFVTSAVTGLIMARSQPGDPERFAAAARVHTASNIVLVPLLTMAYSDILFE